MKILDHINQVNDVHEIDRVSTTWGYSRDYGDWISLNNCFHPDATINISWFSGPANEFIERSKIMLSEFKPGEHSKHQIGRARIQVEGDRATCECHVELLRRVVPPHLSLIPQLGTGALIFLKTRRQCLAYTLSYDDL